MYKLTEEGLRYLKNGLPEANLAKILTVPMTLEEAGKRIENLQIALQWAKKKGWVRLESGRLTSVKKPDKIPEQEALSSIEQNRPVPPNMVSLLLRRRLIRKEKEDVYKRAEKLVGKEIAGLTPELIKTGLWRKTRLKPYNITAGGKRLYPGKRQPYNRFLSEVRQRLVELGFKEMTGPLIELEFWNFDALYQAQDHPSRDWAQTYTLKYPKLGSLPNRRITSQVKATHENGWKTGSTGWGYRWDPKKAAQLMPRAHTTACSARQLSLGVEVPGKYFAISRCFRPDVIDATHGVEFNQCEGIIIAETLDFREMLGTLKLFATEIADAKKVKFFPDYYPFTEPSVQLSAEHPKMGWIEFAGAGIFREELTKPLGIEKPVLAWGLGIDRLAMFKLNIQDIRHLFTRDLEWLRDQKVIAR